MIRALLLDLGNVLVAFDHMKTCHLLGPASGLPPEEVYRRLFVSGLERDFDLGRVAPAEFAARACEALENRVEPDQLLEAWQGIFSRVEENLALLEPLSQRFRTVLLSNTNATHYLACLRLVPELSFLEAHVLSFREGACKPDPALFQVALAQAGVAPGEALLIDDGAANVAGARALGIQAVQHPPASPMAPALRTRGLLP